VLETAGYAEGLGKTQARQGPLRRFTRAFIHFWSYHLFLKHRHTAVTHVAGFRLTVPPTVFHPKVFLTSKYFAGFIGGLDLEGKTVAEVGCGPWAGSACSCVPTWCRDGCWRRPVTDLHRQGPSARA